MVTSLKCPKCTAEIPLSDAFRKEIEAEMLAEERREEAILRLCEDAGLKVYRRPFANPLAVLGVAPRKRR